jgi:hypothetical protein
VCAHAHALRCAFHSHTRDCLSATATAYIKCFNDAYNANARRKGPGVEILRGLKTKVRWIFLVDFTARSCAYTPDETPSSEGKTIELFVCQKMGRREGVEQTTLQKAQCARARVRGR